MASIRWQVASAVLARVGSLTLPAYGVLGSVLLSEAVHDAATTLAPSVVVVTEDERVGKRHFGGHLWVLYPVLVLLIAPRGRQAPDARLRDDARETIRVACYTPSLPPVASVFNVAYEPRPGPGLGSWKKVFGVSAQRFVYTASESMAVA